MAGGEARGTPAELLAQLQSTITDARRLLQGAQVRPEHLVLDEALVRYLIQAIEAADAIAVLVGVGHARGGRPLVRHLFEIATDVIYLLTEQDPDETACRSVVTDILAWDRFWKLQQEAEGQDPDLVVGAHRKPSLTADQAIRNFAAAITAEGGDGARILTLYESAGRMRRRHWHWSGVSRTAMLKQIRQRAVEPHLATLVAILFT